MCGIWDIRGATKECAIMLSRPGGNVLKMALRLRDEFVRHKVLD